jgi:tyrosyl-tRNA synthetase
MLLQAFDFCHLRQEFGCELQTGATDQWGNITAGIDLCRKKLHAPVWGLTHPLLTKSDGTKYGKSASGAVWLSTARTSPYRFYQFFIQSEDADVGKLLRVLTFLPADQIEDLERQQTANPGARPAQTALARELTTLVHGAQACEDAVRASAILFGGELAGVQETTFNEIVGEVPSHQLERTRLDGAGCALTELLVHAGLSGSKGQARKDIEGGGIYINNVRETSVQRHVTTPDLLFGKHILVRKGKRTYAVITAQ